MTTKDQPIEPSYYVGRQGKPWVEPKRIGYVSMPMLQWLWGHPWDTRALGALVGYGTDEFLEVFYSKMGKHYMEPHEQGLRDLFKAIREEVLPALSKIDRLRELAKEIVQKK